MRKPNKVVNARRFNIAFLIFPIKLILLGISVYALDPISSRIHKTPTSLATDIREYLYFTNISLVYTIFSVFLGFFHKFNKKISKIYKFCVATALVLEFIVTITFWILYAINPALVKNKSDFIGTEGPSMIRELPKHLVPTAILILEQTDLYFSRKWCHRLFFIAFCFIYYIISEVYTLLTAKFLYPFFKYFTDFQRFIFFSFMTVFALLLYELFMVFKAKRTKVKRR